MPLIDLGTRCLLQIHGPDAVRYLNGQITQDVRLLRDSADTALPACITDAKGRLQGFITLYQIKIDPVTLWIEAPLELRDSMFARLARYLIADDAEIEDLSDSYRLLHVVDETPEPGDFSYPRYGITGYDRWVPAGSAVMYGEFLPIEEVEAMRISHGIPLWGRELTEGMLPPEAGLDRFAISYQKGCYTGQEVISRIRSAGKMNRQLFRFHLKDEGISPSDTLIDEAGNEVGTLTSIGKTQALGYLTKKGFKQTSFDIRLRDGSVVRDAVSVQGPS
ncbi:MAG: hypothetical protein RLZZ553_1381 [Verrucomicrobiota bacterium]|jgi:folate-binding protein YgfZ